MAADGLSGQEHQTFRVSTRLVEVSVVVHKDGKPVSGLNADDFRLYDSGQEQRIEFFSVHTDVSATAAVAAAPLPAPPASGVHEFSNRIPTLGGATLILFDRVNTRVQDQMYARKHLLDFLRQMKSDDRVGIYVLEGDSIRVLHDFTNDASSLVRALARYRAMTSREVAGEEAAADVGASGDPALDAELAAFLESASAEMTRHFGRLRAEGTMAALEAIANHLSAVQRRKNPIWISCWIPTPGARTSREHNNSDTARDASPQRCECHAARRRRARVDRRHHIRTKRQSDVHDVVDGPHQRDMLQIVSGETGGRTFYNTNDINSAVRRAVDDSRVSYTLGYYPAPGRWDGTYRQIKVKVNLRGVEVRHRKGYLAGNARSSLASKEAAAAEAARSRAIRSALLSPLEATGIGMTAQLEHVAGTASDVKVIIDTVLGAIALEQNGGIWEGRVDVVIA